MYSHHLRLTDAIDDSVSYKNLAKKVQFNAFKEALSKNNLGLVAPVELAELASQPNLK